VQKPSTPYAESEYAKASHDSPRIRLAIYIRYLAKIRGKVRRKVKRKPEINLDARAREILADLSEERPRLPLLLLLLFLSTKHRRLVRPREFVLAQSMHIHTIPSILKQVRDNERQ